VRFLGDEEKYKGNEESKESNEDSRDERLENFRLPFMSVQITFLDSELST
jgi:hypothetical protein